MPAKKLSVDIPSDLARLISRAVAEGAYGSDSEVVADALRLWQKRRQRLQAIRTGLNVAAADPKRYTNEEVTACLDRELAEALSSVR